MKAKVLSLWESVHTSFWFLPTVVSLVAIGAAFGFIFLDKWLSLEGRAIGKLFYPGGPEGARQVLATIAGSVITVAGVTFSITIAALTMASQQFGPRLLRNFMADKGNQFVLGTFVGTFIYCLLVLRTVQGNDRATFVPEISVTFGIVLALASFGILIYFFHHASTSIQAEQVVDTIYRELMGEIDHTFPEEPPDDAETPQGYASSREPGERTVVVSESSGYLRTIDIEGLVSLAVERDLVIRAEYRAGDFVFEGTPLVTTTGERTLDSDDQKKIRRAFVLGKYRSLEQDVEFPVQQLVDMALRALSPSLNDPYTAVNCIDRLGGAMCHLNTRQPAPAYRHDKAGNLRLILDVPTYAGMVDAAFNQIRQNTQRSLAVSIRLLETLQAIAVTTRREEQRKAIHHHAEMIHRAGQEACTEASDRSDLEQRFQQVMQKLEPPKT